MMINYDLPKSLEDDMQLTTLTNLPIYISVFSEFFMMIDHAYDYKDFKKWKLNPTPESLKVLYSQVLIHKHLWLLSSSNTLLS